MSSRPARTAPAIANADDFGAKAEEYAVADQVGEGELREPERPGFSCNLGCFSFLLARKLLHQLEKELVERQARDFNRLPNDAQSKAGCTLVGWTLKGCSLD